MERWIVKFALCLLPLAVVPAFFFAIAEGLLNFGGGEKDIILMFPMAFWALLYAITFAVMWARGNDTRSCIVRGVLVASAPLMAGWIGLVIWTTVAGF